MIVKINCFMVLLPFRQKLLSRDKGYILSLCVDHILFHFALPYQGLNESLSLHCSTVQIRIFWLYNTLLSFHLLVFLMYLQKYCESLHSKYYNFNGIGSCRKCPSGKISSERVKCAIVAQGHFFVRNHCPNRFIIDKNFKSWSPAI